jgi:hypothetical protein
LSWLPIAALPSTPSWTSPLQPLASTASQLLIAVPPTGATAGSIIGTPTGSIIGATDGHIFFPALETKPRDGAPTPPLVDIIHAKIFLIFQRRGSSRERQQTLIDSYAEDISTSNAGWQVWIKGRSTN